MRIPELSLLVECSGGSTPTVEMMKQYISMISAMGYRQLYLGLTDAFKMENEPYFNYKRGGYDRDALRELDSFASECGVELIASIQTLSHLHYLKKYNVYTPLFDTDNILMVGKPEVYELIEHMFEAISAGLHTKRIHIGFDEACGLGLGRYLRENGYRPQKELMAEHLHRVVEIAEKYGYICEIWSDMFFQEKDGCKFASEEMRFALPEGVRLILWEYYQDDPDKLRNLLQEGKSLCENLSFAGSAFKICGFAPSNHYSISRVLPQIKACMESGIEQYILTLWADGGGLCSINAVLPTIFAAAEYAMGNWDGEGEPDVEKFAKITGAVYSDIFSLDYLNDPFRKDLLTLNSRSYWILFGDILLCNYDSYLAQGTAEAYAALAKMYRGKTTGKFSYLFRTAADLANLLSVKAELGIRLRKAYLEKDKGTLRRMLELDFDPLKRAIRRFARVYQRQWLRENFCFGLEVIQLFLGGQMLRYQYIEERIRSYLDKGEAIEELEGRWLPPCIIPPITEDSCLEMNYRNLISCCGI
jgi:putative glycosyl hydrolase, family 20